MLLKVIDAIANGKTQTDEQKILAITVLITDCMRRRPNFYVANRRGKIVMDFLNAEAFIHGGDNTFSAFEMEELR